MKIEKNILSLMDKFDIFFFDAFGVLWDGSDFYENTKEALEELVSAGKIVVIVSNAIKISENAERSYGKKGLVKGVHYNYMVTSGSMIRNHFENAKIAEINELKKSKNKEGLKIYIYGNGDLSAIVEGDSGFIDKMEKIEDISDADFVYINTPRFSNEEYEKYIATHPENKKFLIAYEKDKDGNITQWESLDISIFAEEIKKLAKTILKNDLLVVNPNPDCFANSEDLITGAKVIAPRSGSVVKELRKNGVKKIIEFGKPNKNIYEFTFDVLKKDGVNVEGKRIAMIGDTLATDIKGANNIGISSVLCCKTGITGDHICNGCSLEKMIADEEVMVDYFIEGVGEVVKTND